MKNLFDQFSRSQLARRIVGVVGLLMVLPMALWLLLGFTGAVPSMLSVFGMEGLRTPASIVIGGLLIAAVGFWDYDTD